MPVLLRDVNNSAWRDRELQVTPKPANGANLSILEGIQTENALDL